MNQIIPKSALNITKGGEPSKYTYYGDSGKVSCFFFLLIYLSNRLESDPFPNLTTGCQLLLLPTLHHPYLPPPRSDGSRYDCRPHRFVEGRKR